MIEGPRYRVEYRGDPFNLADGITLWNLNSKYLDLQRHCEQLEAGVLEPLPLCVDIVERLTASKKVMEMQRNEARAKIRDLEAELLQKTQQLRCEHCGMKVDDAQ